MKVCLCLCALLTACFTGPNQISETDLSATVNDADVVTIDAGTRVCGDSECSASQACVRELSDGGIAAAECRTLPAQCVSNPNCACVFQYDSTYQVCPLGTSCYDNGEGDVLCVPH